MARLALAGAKAVLDPQGVLNPGVLFDPVNRRVGITGALAADWSLQETFRIIPT